MSGPKDLAVASIWLTGAALANWWSAPQRPFATLIGLAAGWLMLAGLWAGWRWLSRRYRVRVERRDIARRLDIHIDQEGL